MLIFIFILFQFDAEFRRFSVPKPDISTYNEFKILVEKLHHLDEIPFHLTYIATDGDLLPINNDSNLGKALLNSFLRVIVQRKGK
jgi:PB1 domain.